MNKLNIVIDKDPLYGAYLMNGEKQVGRFEITKDEPKQLSINIDDGYQGQGHTRTLISELCNYLKEKVFYRMMIDYI